MRRFGAQIFYGDAGRPDILRAAGADKARAFVLAIDNVEASLRVGRDGAQRYFPDLPIYARARDRTHVHRLMDLGVRSSTRDVPGRARTDQGSAARPRAAAARGSARPRPSSGCDERRLYEDYQVLHRPGEGAGQRAHSGRSSRSCSRTMRPSCLTRMARRCGLNPSASPPAHEMIEDQAIELRADG